MSNLDRTRDEINRVINEVARGDYATTTALDAVGGTQTISFSTAIRTDRAYRTEHTVATPISYTLDESVDNTKGKRIDHLVASGISGHEPAFDLAKFNIAWGNYKNELGAQNRIYFEAGTNGKIDVYITYK